MIQVHGGLFEGDSMGFQINDLGWIWVPHGSETDKAGISRKMNGDAMSNRLKKERGCESKK